MCQPHWWDGSEQMPELLRRAGDQMFDARVWRGPAVVGDGIEPPTSTELAEHDPSRWRLLVLGRKRTSSSSSRKPGSKPGFLFISACPDRGHRPVRRHRA